jgi:hypothetical protein
MKHDKTVAFGIVGAGAGGDPKAIPVSGHIGLISNFMDALRGKGSLFNGANEGCRISGGFFNGDCKML